MTGAAALFDAEADRYPDSVGEDFTQARKWALIADHAARNALAVDVGAANGRHALPFAAAGGRVVAVDPSPAMLGRLSSRAAASGLGDRVLACGGGLPELPLAAGRFDLVYCFATLLLLPPRAQDAAIGEMAALLRPGGTLVVDIAGARSLAIRYWRRHYRRRGLAGVFGQTLPQARALLARHGLTVTDVHAHGLLSQLLLFPGLGAIGPLVRLVRGRPSRAGLDAVASGLLPGLAERWFFVARRAGGDA